VARYRGERVCGAGASSGARSGDFATRLHESAVSDRGEQEWKCKLMAQNAYTKIAARCRYRVPRTEGHIIEDTAIFTKCDFSFSAPIQVVEHGARNPASSDLAKVGYANCVRGSN
jgi:hypothetical protein